MSCSVADVPSPPLLTGLRQPSHQRCPHQSPASGWLSRTYSAHAFLSLRVCGLLLGLDLAALDHQKKGEGENLQLVPLRAPHPAVTGPSASTGLALCQAQPWQTADSSSDSSGPRSCISITRAHPRLPVQGLSCRGPCPAGMPMCALAPVWGTESLK